MSLPSINNTDRYDSTGSQWVGNLLNVNGEFHVHGSYTAIDSNTGTNSTTKEKHPSRWIVPFDRNPSFTGREAQLTQLEAKLFPGTHTSKIAVVGLGGVGKTQLVLELLYRTREKHEDCLIMWIPATSMESLEQGYLTVALQLKIPGSDEKATDAKALVRDYLSRDDAGLWLLVIDNADDISMWTTVTENSKQDHQDDTTQNSSRSCRLIDYLPRNKRGCIIFTTRDKKAAVKLAQQNIVYVPEMDEDTAMQLLRNSLTDPGAVDQPEAVAKLLAALTYLPLAITQATAYINANSLTLLEYLSLLQEKEEEVIEILSEDFEDHGRYQEVKNPIASTWLISFEQIRRSDPLAADYLSFIACISPRDIPLSILPSGPSRKKELDAVGTLVAYSFVNRRPADSVLDLHRLVHLATRNWLRNEEVLNQWTKKVVDHLENVFPSGNNDQHRATWRAYSPHVQQVLASQSVSEEEVEEEEYDVKTDLMWKYAREIQERHVDDLNLQPSTSWLASIYKHQGRWKEAEQLQVPVLDYFKTEFGIGHENTLSSMQNLASTYEQQGRWAEAVQLLEEVTKKSETQFGLDHSETMNSMSELAWIYMEQGRLTEAEQLQVQVLERRRKKRKKQGVDYAATLIDMNILASIYYHQGRLQEAESLFLYVLEKHKTKLGLDHPLTLVSIHNLATIYTKQNRYTEAEHHFIHVMETRKMKLGADHPDTLSSACGLAYTYEKQGRWREAEQLSTHVLEMRKRKLGADHPRTIESMIEVAEMRKRLSRHAQGIQLMEECVELGLRVLGAAHPLYVSAQESLTGWKAEQSNMGTSLIPENIQPHTSESK